MPQPQVDWRYDNNLMGAMRDDPLYNLNGLNDPSAQYDALTRAGWTHDDIMDVYDGTAIGTIGRLRQQYETPPIEQRGQVGGFRYQFPASQRRVANATGTQVGDAVGAAAAGGTPATQNTQTQQQQLPTVTVNQQPAQQPQQPAQPAAQGNTASAGGVTITSPLLGQQQPTQQQQPAQQPAQQQQAQPVGLLGQLGNMASQGLGGVQAAGLFANQASAPAFLTGLGGLINDATGGALEINMDDVYNTRLYNIYDAIRRAYYGY